MLGKGGMFIDECVAGGYIGADFGIREDLTIYHQTKIIS